MFLHSLRRILCVFIFFVFLYYLRHILGVFIFFETYSSCFYSSCFYSVRTSCFYRNISAPSFLMQKSNATSFNNKSSRFLILWSLLKKTYGINMQGVFLGCFLLGFLVPYSLESSEGNT